MRFSLLSILFGLGSVASVWGQTNTAEAFFASESPIAKTGLLANIGPSGSKSSGAKSGVVIASPSRSSPDYLYTWTRDSALVFLAIVNQYTLGLDNSLRSQIDNYVGAQKIQQQVSNPSGSVSSGGLGEPKFHIDLSAFTGGWGRPQRDGPGLRATTLITWAEFLLTQGNTSYVTNELWPIIKLDLDYVASTWSQSGFDLWEEVNSSGSFFTTASHLRSLRQGIRLATAIGQTSVVSGYTTQVNAVLCYLQTYWDSNGFVNSNKGGGRTGKDANSLIASNNLFDAAAGCDTTTFQPCSDRALSNLLQYVDTFRSWAINSGIATNQGIATGRYSEDSYYGGNPWYLTTLAVSEQLYNALTVWKAQGTIKVTAVSLPFFQRISPSASVGEYASGTATFTTLTTAVKTYADSFVSIVAKYTPSNGGLSEQYTKTTGAPTSATDLTWSYASVLTALDAREGVIPASWGAAGLTLPSTCSNSGGGGTGGGGGATVAVTFKVSATTVWGESIFLTGSIAELANWSPDNALALNADNYPIWTVTVNIPASATFQYKYIRKYNGVKWESDPNRQFTAPASGSYVINDGWR
ncbi:glucoamylase [Crucibulum laeve]|uniref:Glucoamylase n=1 Tax=Crucibulum laeve TaxID=68775 RepID=A0A5C3MJT1_9AGAR|nr:glucoamylase [Crucibulum laeve]